MNPAVKVAAGVAGGYLLGRHKKLRYAVGFGAALLGKRLDLNPSRLVLTGVKSLRELPEVMDLGDTVRGELATSGRRAAMTLMTNRLDSLSDTLRDRSTALESGGGSGRSEQQEGQAQRDEQAHPHDDVYPEESQQSGGAGQRDRKRTPAGRGRAASGSRAEEPADTDARDDRDVDEPAYDDEPDDIDASDDRDRDRDEQAYDDEPPDADARDDRDLEAGYDDEDEFADDGDLPDEDDTDRDTERDDATYDDIDDEDEPAERRRPARRRAGANA